MSVKQRMKNLPQSGSIANHKLREHDTKIRSAGIKKDIKTSCRSIEKIDFIYVEPLLFKPNKPHNNMQK